MSLIITFMFEPREAAYELSEGERQQEAAPRDSRARRCGGLSHRLRDGLAAA